MFSARLPSVLCSLRTISSYLAVRFVTCYQYCFIMEPMETTGKAEQVSRFIKEKNCISCDILCENGRQ